MMKNSVIMMLMSLLFPFVMVYGTTIHVPSQQSTIQAGIDIANNSDTVLVADGAYYENINFAGKLIVVKSENGPDATSIISNQYGMPVVNFSNYEDRNAKIEGFTISGDLSYWGIYVQNAGPWIYGNKIINCEAGIWANQSQGMVIRKNDITGCHHGTISPHNGGAIRLIFSSDAVIDSNLMYENYANVGGAIYFWQALRIDVSRNLFYSNSSQWIGAFQIYDSDYIDVINNTFARSTGPGLVRGALTIENSTYINVINNIFSYNANYGLYFESGNSNVVEAYNDFYQNSFGDINTTPGTGTIFLNPLFVDIYEDDYYLTEGSPCIDSGDPSLPYDPDGSIADMGAFVYGLVEGYFALDIAEAYGEQGNRIDVPIIATGFSAGDLAGAEFHLEYDESCISNAAFTSEYLDDASFNAAENEIHILWEDFEDPANIPDGAVIFTLSFDILAELGVECPITWQENCELVDPLGNIIIGAEYFPGAVFSTTLNNMTGSVRYYNTSLPVENVDLYLDGFLTDQTISDASGLYAFMDFPPGDYSICPGRLLDDPGVTVNDIVAIRQHIVELNIFGDPFQMIAADVNDNGRVTVADIIKIRRYLAELEDLPSGNWMFVDSTLEITFENWYDAPSCIDVEMAGEDITGLNFIGIRKGDVDCSWGSDPGSLACLEDSVSLQLLNVACEPGEAVLMPIAVTGFNDVAGLEIHISYPLEYVDVVSMDNELFYDPTINYGNGQIHFVWDDIVNLFTINDGEEILNFEFQTLQGAPDTIPITFTAVHVCDEYAQNFIVGTYDGYVITGPVVIDDDPTGLPNSYNLNQNYPNPFNATTSIEFQLPESAPVKLTVYDIQGREVEQLIDSEMSAGIHNINWHADKYPSGMYLYKLSAGEFSQTKKMLLLK